MSGSIVTAARGWARDLKCYLHLGSFLERDADDLHNTAVLIDPDGEIVHTYRKIHVFGYQSREAELLSAGDSVGVAPTGLGPVAATTCYDLRFPELWRALVDAGAETVIVPAAWPAQRRQHWQVLTQCRAHEQQVLVCAANAVGRQSDVELGGHSRVVDPWGRILLEADDREGVFTCEIADGLVDATRAEFPVLNDRVPSIKFRRNPSA